jgi:hypothetical protein
MKNFVAVLVFTACLIGYAVIVHLWTFERWSG